MHITQLHSIAQDNEKMLLLIAYFFLTVGLRHTLRHVCEIAEEKLLIFISNWTNRPLNVELLFMHKIMLELKGDKISCMHDTKELLSSVFVDSIDIYRSAVLSDSIRGSLGPYRCYGRTCEGRPESSMARKKFLSVYWAQTSCMQFR